LEQVQHLSFNPRGDLLASTAWDASTRFWDVNSGELLFLSRAGFDPVFGVDGVRIGYFKEGRTLGIWRANPSRIYRKLSLPMNAAPYFSGFDFSPNGHSLAAVNANGVHVWDFASGEYQAFRPNRNIRSVCFTKDGTCLVLVGANRLNRWRLDPSGATVQLRAEADVDLQPRSALDGGSVTRGVEDVLTVPSMDRVFCVDLGDPSVWWELPGKGLIGGINSTSISPNTNWIATSYWKDRGTSVWDTRTRQRIRSLGPAGGFVSFSPDNRWLLVGSVGAYTLWETGRILNWRSPCRPPTARGWCANSRWRASISRRSANS